MHEERATIISKTLSRILRHNPGTNGGVVIDMQGFTDLATFVPYLNALRPFDSEPLTLSEIEEVVVSDFKQRFQIAGGRIRAYSGHSFPVEIGGEPFYPAGPLYFGTTEKSRRVFEEGLTVSKKLKVRLSYSYQEALAIANARPDATPLVIEVDAERLAADGASFELLPNGEIVADPVGADYLTEAHPPKASPSPSSRH
ncbi:RNA 2'-phosphotransferase [Pararhizobium sp. BT-229]|uniref:RNA 2'-phosphotransferase n=1 Tax=Pararhizobium sp. BT-229 TaxID=2986923 RepID=UPI0021F6B877|nr:RNA 2'-phosphotransferase [Pararhizobium sp. BT-229]MCV9965080.1 RNA 2'-phosphotransferase [Pararhizobium sp. BT-229]